MITSYSSLTKEDVAKEIALIRREGKKIASSPARARAFLIKGGFLTKDGKKLAPRYR